MDIRKKMLSSQEDLVRNINWLCIKYVLTLLIGFLSRVIEKQDEQLKVYIMSMDVNIGSYIVNM